MKTALVYMNNDKLVSRGVGYIAAAVMEAGHSLHFFDTAWNRQEDIVQVIARGNYDVLLISSTSLYHRRTATLADAVKKLLPNLPIVLGGAYPTILKGKILTQCSSIDYICVGEGEKFIQEFLRRLGSGRSISKVKNLGYRNSKGTVIVNPSRPCTNLHKLAPFNYELFNLKSVVQDGELLSGFCYVIATRGCPFNCSYCCNSYYLSLYKKGFLRTQKIDTVIAELLHLKRHYPAKVFYFGDEMILFNIAYVTELFTRIHKEVKMPYGCMFRVEKVTRSLVELMRDTGCCYVAMGIECGDEKFRRQFLNRRGTNRQIVDTFAMFREIIPNIWITSYNMRGYPVSYDDQLTLSTRRLNSQVSPNHVQTTWFFPIHGTRMYDYCVERDLIDWEKMDHAEDYFRRSVIRRPISPSLDTPLYSK